MSGDFFIDTNVIAYTFDDTDSTKRDVARALLQRAQVSGQGVISYQVVQEFLNLATRKFSTPLSVSESIEYLQVVLLPMCKVLAEPKLFIRGLEVRAAWKFSFYDALIIAAAERAQCEVLYTEDMQHGQQVGGVRLINPFLDSEPGVDH